MTELTEDQQAKLTALLDGVDDLLRIKFGPKPHQTLPRETAEALLIRWAATAPASFGANLRAVIVADLPGKNGAGR